MFGPEVSTSTRALCCSYDVPSWHLSRLSRSSFLSGPGDLIEWKVQSACPEKAGERFMFPARRAFVWPLSPDYSTAIHVFSPCLALSTEVFSPNPVNTAKRDVFPRHACPRATPFGNGSRGAAWPVESLKLTRHPRRQRQTSEATLSAIEHPTRHFQDAVASIPHPASTMYWYSSAHQAAHTTPTPV